jgi:ketosteroid isomerase-like protein
MASKNGRNKPTAANGAVKGSLMTFQQALQRHLTAVQERDLDTFLDTIASDGSLALILPNGAYLDEYQEIVEMHQEWFADLEWRMNVELVNQRETPVMASALCLVTYDDVDEAGEPVQFQYFLNLIFAKQGNRWLLVHDQNTIIDTQDADEDEEDE